MRQTDAEKAGTTQGQKGLTRRSHVQLTREKGSNNLTGTNNLTGPTI